MLDDIYTRNGYQTKSLLCIIQQMQKRSLLYLHHHTTALQRSYYFRQILLHSLFELVILTLLPSAVILLLLARVAAAAAAAAAVLIVIVLLSAVLGMIASVRWHLSLSASKVDVDTALIVFCVLRETKLATDLFNARFDLLDVVRRMVALSDDASKSQLISLL